MRVVRIFKYPDTEKSIIFDFPTNHKNSLFFDFTSFKKKLNTDVTFLIVKCLYYDMEREQFIKTILPLRSKLINNAFRFLRDKAEAEDITQEVILRLWSMRDKLAQYSSVEALSFTINKNLCLDKLKAQKRKDQNLTTETISIDAYSPDIILEQKDDTKQVIRIIDQLPDLQQLILKMKHIEGLDNTEIAEITGCTQEAIRANLSRARKKVKDMFLKMQNHGK